MPISPEFYLLNELHGIDNETSALLRSISEKERSIASYLKSLNHKIELIAQTIVQKSSDLEELTPQEVTLSEGGISLPIKINTSGNMLSSKVGITTLLHWLVITRTGSQL